MVNILIKHAKECCLFVFQEGFDDEFFVVGIKEETPTLSLPFTSLKNLISIFQNRQRFLNIFKFDII